MMGKATAKEAEHHQLEAESLVEAAREREYNHEDTIPHHPRHLRRVGDTGDGMMEVFTRLGPGYTEPRPIQTQLLQQLMEDRPTLAMVEV